MRPESVPLNAHRICGLHLRHDGERNAHQAFGVALADFLPELCPLFEAAIVQDPSKEENGVACLDAALASSPFIWTLVRLLGGCSVSA